MTTTEFNQSNQTAMKNAQNTKKAPKLSTESTGRVAKRRKVYTEKWNRYEKKREKDRVKQLKRQIDKGKQSMQSDAAQHLLYASPLATACLLAQFLLLVIDFVLFDANYTYRYDNLDHRDRTYCDILPPLRTQDIMAHYYFFTIVYVLEPLFVIIAFMALLKKSLLFSIIHIFYTMTLILMDILRMYEHYLKDVIDLGLTRILFDILTLTAMIRACVAIHQYHVLKFMDIHHMRKKNIDRKKGKKTSNSKKSTSEANEAINNQSSLDDDCSSTTTRQLEAFRSTSSDTLHSINEKIRQQERHNMKIHLVRQLNLKRHVTLKNFSGILALAIALAAFVISIRMALVSQTSYSKFYLHLTCYIVSKSFGDDNHGLMAITRAQPRTSKALNDLLEVWITGINILQVLSSMFAIVGILVDLSALVYIHLICVPIVVLSQFLQICFSTWLVGFGLTLHLCSLHSICFNALSIMIMNRHCSKIKQQEEENTKSKILFIIGRAIHITKKDEKKPKANKMNMKSDKDIDKTKDSTATLKSQTPSEMESQKSKRRSIRLLGDICSWKSLKPKINA